jgi:hypothetical protein
VDPSTSADAPRQRLTPLAGKLLIAGSAALLIGALLSWNFFRVGTFHFYGKVVLTSGRRLSVLLFGGIAAVHARSVLTHRLSAVRLRRYWSSVILTGSLAILALAQYAAGEKSFLEGWVVGSGANSIASQVASPVAAVKSVLEASIARHDVALTLRPGFYIALAGGALVLAAGVLLFAGTRGVSAPAQERAPGAGLQGVLSKP